LSKELATYFTISQFTPAQALLFCFFKIWFSIILPKPTQPKWALFSRHLHQNTKRFNLGATCPTHLILYPVTLMTSTGRPQWLRSLSRRSAAARLMGLRVRIPPWAQICVSCECCMLSGTGLCDGSIPHPDSPTECGTV